MSPGDEATRSVNDEQVRSGSGWNVAIYVFLLPLAKLNSPCTVPEMPRGLQKFEAARIFRQSAHEGGNVVSPTHRPPQPRRKIPGTHFC